MTSVALVFLLAVFTTLCGAGLLLAAHRRGALVVFSGFGILGLAVAFYDQLIELRSRTRLLIREACS